MGAKISAVPGGTSPDSWRLPRTIVLGYFQPSLRDSMQSSHADSLSPDLPESDFFRSLLSPYPSTILKTLPAVPTCLLSSANPSQKPLARRRVVNDDGLDLKRGDRYSDLSSASDWEWRTLRLLHEVGQRRGDNTRRQRKGHIPLFARPFIKTHQQAVSVLGLLHRGYHHVVGPSLQEREAAGQLSRSGVRPALP